MIAPHRREYLTYEGPISGGRGAVKRVDEGSVLVRAWSDTHIALGVDMMSFVGEIEMTPIADGKWRASVRV